MGIHMCTGLGTHCRPRSELVHTYGELESSRLQSYPSGQASQADVTQSQRFSNVSTQESFGIILNPSQKPVTDGAKEGSPDGAKEG